jgi:hypothetical protein
MDSVLQARSEEVSFHYLLHLILRETNKVGIPPAFLPTVLTMIHQRANHPIEALGSMI